jgi:serine protease
LTTKTVALPAPPPAITPDFTGNQGYLDAAPGGIEARLAWTIPGGDGSGITIYDVEYSWNQTHEDLSTATGAPLLLDPGDAAVDPFSNNNHGTAVLGEMIAASDARGVTGMAWGADIGLAPANTANRGYNPAHAILLAVADGAAGDVILIEQQFPVCGLPDFGPLEWISPVFEAIQTAVANGLVVVEAAGNGAVDLDQPACGPTFNRHVRDSGAIIVGAGFPPSSGADRQREPFSTYGSRVDLQGWGSRVVTTGYGLYRDPDAPADPDFWYTGSFSGTSSASAMAAGAAANLQGIALSWLGVPLTPRRLRALLVDTGNPQLGDTSPHIGPRPNLRQAIAQLGEGAMEVTLDIKPGEDPNAIASRSEGLIPELNMR